MHPSGCEYPHSEQRSHPSFEPSKSGKHYSSVMHLLASTSSNEVSQRGLNVRDELHLTLSQFCHLLRSNSVIRIGQYSDQQAHEYNRYDVDEGTEQQ